MADQDTQSISDVDVIDYLRGIRAVELFLKDARDESRPILTRLHAVSQILHYTKSCKDRFTEVRAEVLATREELKKTSASLLVSSQFPPFA